MHVIMKTSRSFNSIITGVSSLVPVNRLKSTQTMTGSAGQLTVTIYLHSGGPVETILNIISSNEQIDRRGHPQVRAQTRGGGVQSAIEIQGFPRLCFKTFGLTPSVHVKRQAPDRASQSFSCSHSQMLAVRRSQRERLGPY